jgi:hypothetical protein
MLNAESQGTQAGLFSAVSSAFIIDVQSKLEPDPNEMTAAYMRILIHAVNSSLFPDADPDSVIWTGPPPEIVTVQSLLYASLVTSLFVAFLAMLGKQWVNRYLRNRGGSAADKSRDRQRKLDGLEKWYFHLAIEGLPVMLQAALLLLGCALSRYLWMTSRIIAGIILTMTLLGVTLYTFLTLAATFYYNCPFQTPPSILTRTVIRYLTRSDTTLARSLRSLIAPFPRIIHLGRTLKHLRFGVRHVLESFGCIPAVEMEVEHIPLAAAAASPTRIFEDVSIDWDVCKADARCISWVLGFTTDTDVIFSTVRFAADMIWYPEIAGALSPHILADLLSDCILDKQVIPSKSEHASSIGMALASVLSIQLNAEPEDDSLKWLCEHILSDVRWASSSDPLFMLVVAVLRFVANVPTQNEPFLDLELSGSILHRLSTAHQLWLSRVILQTIWRWRRVQGPSRIPVPYAMESICQTFTADDNQIPTILRTNRLLMMAISLGLQIDSRDLYAPINTCVISYSSHRLHSLDTSDTLKVVVRLFHQQLQVVIARGEATPRVLTSVLSTLIHINPLQAMGSGELGFLWISEILNSGYQEHERYQMASEVVQLLGKHFFEHPEPFSRVLPTWIPSILRFLSLCKEFILSPPSPGFIALRILSTNRGSAHFGSMILPVLTSTLQPTHPLQARGLALNAFLRFMTGWFSSQMENIPSNNLGKLLQAVGDPFQFPDLLLQDGKPVGPAIYKPMMATVVLIEFASSDLWRSHLCRPNFTSCEEVVSTMEGKRTAMESMFDVARDLWPDFLCTAAKITTAIRRLEELQCLNTVEVVIMWAWTVGAVNLVDHDDWGLIGHDTLRFYQTHGMQRSTALKKHITAQPKQSRHMMFLTVRYRTFSCGVGSALRPDPTSKPWLRSRDRYFADFYIAQACQLRRLYHLFGYDPATWKEAVAVEVVGEETDRSLGGCAKPDPLIGPFIDWECDYP